MAVHGVIRFVDHERIAVLRDDPEAGRVCVHFPRVGHRVETGCPFLAQGWVRDTFNNHGYIPMSGCSLQ